MPELLVTGGLLGPGLVTGGLASGVTAPPEPPGSGPPLVVHGLLGPALPTRGLGAPGTTQATPRPTGSCAPNLMRRGAAWHARQLKAHASHRVLVKTDTGSVELCATLGTTLLKLDDSAGGVRMEWTDQDFIIPREDFVIGVSPVVPARGQLYHLVLGGRLLTYEAFPYGGEPPWRWCDPYHTLMRVHTKLVAEEDA